MQSSSSSTGMVIGLAALGLGLVWSIWHLTPDIQNKKAIERILWHRIYSVALRILIVWIYNDTGKSVFAAILRHTLDKVTVFLFPNYGSHYNLFLVGMISWLTAGVAILGWGAQTLGRFRFARLSRA